MNRNYLLIGLAVAVAGFIFWDFRKIKRLAIPPPTNNGGPSLSGGVSGGINVPGANQAAPPIGALPAADGGTGAGKTAGGTSAGGWNPGSSNASVT